MLNESNNDLDGPDKSTQSPDQEGSINISASGDVSAQNVVGRDQVNIQQTFNLQLESILADTSKHRSNLRSYLPIILNPGLSDYPNRKDVSLLIRLASSTANMDTHKIWTTEERRGIKAWLKASPLCRWVDQYFGMQGEKFAWEITHTQAHILRLSYLPQLPPRSPIIVEANLYNPGIAYFDIIFGTSEIMKEFLSQPRPSVSFLKQQAMRFRGEQKLSWREAYQLTLAGWATLNHAKFRDFCFIGNHYQKVHIYLRSNEVSLDQSISGQPDWERRGATSRQDDLLQEEPGGDGSYVKINSLDWLNRIAQSFWGRCLLDWGYLGFEEDLEKQPPEAITREIQSAYEE